MGGFSSAVASPMMQYGMSGLASGMKTGTAIATNMYNAASARMQAKALESQSNLQAYLIRQQYETEYRELQQSQERQQSMNRVMQAKHGMSGASATEVMASYAGKAQKNLETLYYNAAMKTGQQSLRASSQISMLKEKARQYDWAAVASGIAGVVDLGTSMLGTYNRQLAKTSEINPTKNLEAGVPDPVLVKQASSVSWGLAEPSEVTDMSGLVITPLTE